MRYGLKLLWSALRPDYVGKVSMTPSDELFLHDSLFVIAVNKKHLNNGSFDFFFGYC